MLLDEILNEWEEDSAIDDKNLDGTTVKCAMLHAKYLKLFSVAKLRLKKKDADLSEMRKDKWLYFSGKMTKEEMDARGWKYDPFDGMIKPLKSDIDMYCENDPEIRKLKAQIDYTKTIIEALDEILSTIRWRHQAIRNIIDFKKFVAGY
jgi:hypothetical protein